MSYTSAIQIVKGLQDLDGPNVNPACHTRLYTHGRPTERALLLLHGFTNCPAQFDALGRIFFERGWNVLIPRYPRHGYKDRLSTAIAELRADHLFAVANRGAEAAAGLGERVTVAGLSLGGILTGHIAETREVERAVLIAPMFGLKPIPAPALAALTQIAYVVPNFYVWWNAKARDGIGPPHGYPRFATHAYAALFTTASRVMAAARRARPKAASIGVITNAAEPRLDNRHTRRLVAAWRGHGADVDTFEFPAADRLPHDLIDPVANPPQVTGRSYPVVARMIDGSSPPEPS
ncbi:MAG TPA: alpha/beta hydrolase [Candidatus Dormibacteraeota bacterium]|nr:alpha/beta hydrolase [Candidatus Dormibacteraeota bacterium]